jgi:hypothetical protein
MAGDPYASDLVVDDDLHVCLAIKAWLGRYGFAVADDGTAGLIALDNSIFDLMTQLGVIDERLGKAAPRRPAKAYGPKGQRGDV